MRQTRLLFLLTIALLMSSSYTYASINVGQVRKLLQRNASLTEVRDQLGIPAEEMATLDFAQARYVVKGVTYSLRFGKQHRLQEVAVNYGKDRLNPTLRYEEVRRLRHTKHLEEVEKLLGMPSNILINENEETWNYRNAQSELAIKMDVTRAEDGLRFFYLKRDANAQFNMLDADRLEKLVRGETQVSQLPFIFGAPKSIRLTDKEEEWTYTSENTTLTVLLDKNGLLTDYRYRNMTDKKG